VSLFNHCPELTTQTCLLKLVFLYKQTAKQIQLVTGWCFLIPKWGCVVILVMVATALLNFLKVMLQLSQWLVKGPIQSKGRRPCVFDYKAGLGSILILWKYQSLSPQRNAHSLYSGTEHYNEPSGLLELCDVTTKQSPLLAMLQSQPTWTPRFGFFECLSECYIFVRSLRKESASQ